MKKKYILSLVSILLLSLSASAQFYVNGDDPGKLKWNYIDTDSYRIIYPTESDSLAHVYARKLETFKIPVSRTTGYMTGHGDGKLMPVVLHTYQGNNGSVAWAPKRMDFYTLPSPFDVEPLPWSTMLSVHESRHVTQMQFGMTNMQKPFGYMLGEMWNILVSIVYPNMYYMEGDAVVAETALTKTGRGRTADFLNYYRIAFDNGDFRDWNKWLYGSQRNYYPDHYSLGYMTLANLRTMYDYPTYMHDAYDHASRHIFDLIAFETVSKKKTGLSQKDMFKEISLKMNEMWQKEDSLRAPFMEYEALVSEPRLYTSYRDNLAVGEDIYSVKSGYLNAPILVRIDADGNENFVSRFSYHTGRMQKSEDSDRIYWSEDIPDERWSLKTDAKIRYIETAKPSKKRTLKSKGNLYHPAVSGSRLAATEYRVDGKSPIAIIDSNSGEVLKSLETPDTLQIVETAWVGDMLYATAVSESGFGIYGVCPGESWTKILAPQAVKVKDFQSYGDELMFTSDRTGVNELYHFNPSTGKLTQKTSTKYGASDFAYSTDGEYLYFSAATLKGDLLSRVKAEELLDREVCYEDIHKYELADKLAEQEKELAVLNGYSEAVPVLDSIYISEPKKYSKGGHMFNVHSWTPVYVNVDNIMNMSFDKIYQAASLGFSGIMQNRHSTGVGEFGYSAHRDPLNKSIWRHSGHAKFTYSGLYPVFEASIDFNDRGARQYILNGFYTEEATSVGLSTVEIDRPFVTGNIRMYIPFNFSEGGWYRGVIPQVNYRISNDMLDTGINIYSLKEEDGSDGTEPVFMKRIDGKNKFRHSLTGAVRGYTVLSTPNSAVYPKWGIGLEVGASTNLERKATELIGDVNIFSPMGYAYLYGYVPGLISVQGLKLTATHQQSLSKKSYFNQALVNTLPRGLTSSPDLFSWLAIRSDSMTRFTADYGIPVYIGDVGLFGGFFFIKRLVLTPHFDYMFAGNGLSYMSDGYQLYSAGCDLNFDLNSLLWLGWPCSVGVTFSYNGGPSFSGLNEIGLNLGRTYVGPTFNVSF